MALVLTSRELRLKCYYNLKQTDRTINTIQLSVGLLTTSTNFLSKNTNLPDAQLIRMH